MIADGYKDTEVGVIPIEWAAIELGDIATFSRGKGISKKDISEDGVECIRYGELFTTYNEIITTIKSKTNSTTNMMYSKVNDTLMPTSDVTPNGLATASALNKEGVVLGGDILIIRSNDILNSYLSYFIRSNKKQIMKLVSGSTVYHIYGNDMKKLKIPLPPLKEQEKIADILSTADDKIDAIASQIQKTEKLKKGLLQKLLSEGIGHSEFKNSELGEIPESWEVVELRDIGKVSMCKRIMKSETTIDGEIPFYKIGTFGKKADAYISQELYTEYTNKYSFPNEGDILISASGTIGRTVIYDGKLAYFQDSNIVWIANQEDKSLNSFLFYVYITVKWHTDGNTIARLYNENLRRIKIPLPPLEEQKQIANILSTAADKLEVLRAKKEKYETLKIGLLQKLLSGELRV